MEVPGVIYTLDGRHTLGAAEALGYVPNIDIKGG